MLKPSIVDQYELGVKNNFFNNKLSANLSVYRIINSNLARQAEFKADGTLNSDATLRELKDQTMSNCVELDLNGTISRNFYFIAGYGYNDMRFTKTSGAKGTPVQLGDTTIDGITHSKIKFSYGKEDPSKYYTIGYLRCGYIDSLFSLEKKYSPGKNCTMTKLYSYVIGNPLPYASESVIYLSDSLSVNELKVFDAWNKKANESK